MHYELSTGLDGVAIARVCERRAGYRRNWYAERDDDQGSNPVTAEAEQRVLTGAGRVRFRRMLALSERLARAPLPELARRDFLELEEMLHAHWLALAIEHYNLGVETGLLEAALERDAPERLPARERLRALADALRKAIEQL